VNGTENDLWIVIPTANRHQYLQDIFINSGIPLKNIVLVRTAEGERIEDVWNIWDLDEFNIHRWWNTGIRFAENHGASYVAVLNDDIWLAPKSLQSIVTAMEESGADLGYPDPHSGDVCGYAWVLRVASGIRPDERYRWWFGDNDLRNQARAGNGIAKGKADIRHLHPNETTVGKYFEVTKQDGEKFYEKWNTTSRM
jgi:hypothetical protein